MCNDGGFLSLSLLASLKIMCRVFLQFFRETFGSLTTLGSQKALAQKALALGPPELFGPLGLCMVDPFSNPCLYKGTTPAASFSSLCF